MKYLNSGKIKNYSIFSKISFLVQLNLKMTKLIIILATKFIFRNFFLLDSNFSPFIYNLMSLFNYWKNNLNK